MSTAGGSGVTSTSTSKAGLKPGTVHVVKPNSKTLPDMIELMVSTSHPPYLPRMTGHRHDASVVAHCFLTFKMHVATECVNGTLDIVIVVFICSYCSCWMLRCCLCLILSSNTTPFTNFTLPVLCRLHDLLEPGLSIQNR